MANGFRGGDAGFTGTSPGGFQTVSPLAIPELMELFERIQDSMPGVADLSPLFQEVQRKIPSQTESFESILSQGTGSPLIRQVLEMLAPSLATGEEQAREALTDRFRSAGALRSGAYGVAAPRLEGELAAKRGGIMAQLIQSMLAPLISGSLRAQEQSFLPAQTLMQLLPSILQSQQNQFLPSRGLTDLLQAARPQVNFNQPFAGVGGGDRVSGPFDILSDGSRASERTAQAQRDFLGDPFLGGSFSGRGGASTPSSPTQVSAPRLLDQFVDPNIYADPFAGITTGSLNNFFRDPFTGGYSNFPSDIESLPFFDPVSGAFEY